NICQPRAGLCAQESVLQRIDRRRAPQKVAHQQASGNLPSIEREVRLVLPLSHRQEWPSLRESEEEALPARAQASQSRQKEPLCYHSLQQGSVRSALVQMGARDAQVSRPLDRPGRTRRRTFAPEGN